MRPYRIETPPDERGDWPPTPAVAGGGSSPDLPDQIDFDTIAGMRLQPCGHIFREADIEAVESGEIYTQELGDRVLNPGTSNAGDHAHTR